MQRPIALALTAIFIIVGGAFLIINDKSTTTNWPSDDAKDKPKIASSSSSSPQSSSSSGGGGSGGSGGGSGSGSGSSGSVSAVPDILHDKATQPSTDTTVSPSDKTTQGDNSSKQTTIGSDTSGKTNSLGSHEPENRTTPVKAAPVNTSPPPPPPKQVPSGTLLLTESLQYMKDGRMLLAGPQNTLTYPIIRAGTSYSGTIGSSGSLSQIDISRLIGYPSPAVVNVPPPATHKEGHNVNGNTVWTEVPYNPVSIPIGSYPSNAGLKQAVDGYISTAGPHIQRKLHTGEWVFTPAPSASYKLDWNAIMFGMIQIRGVLKVRYDKTDNILGLEPNAWYQGDVETGWSTHAFFGGAEARNELTGLIILGNWGRV